MGSIYMSEMCSLVYIKLLILADVDKPQGDEDSKPSKVPQGDLGPNLDRLWAYTCPLTKGLNVSCIAWNKINPVSITMLSCFTLRLNEYNFYFIIELDFKFFGLFEQFFKKKNECNGHVDNSVLLSFTYLMYNVWNVQQWV